MVGKKFILAEHSANRLSSLSAPECALLLHNFQQNWMFNKTFVDLASPNDLIFLTHKRSVVPKSYGILRIITFRWATVKTRYCFQYPLEVLFCFVFYFPLLYIKLKGCYCCFWQTKEIFSRLTFFSRKHYLEPKWVEVFPTCPFPSEAWKPFEKQCMVFSFTTQSRYSAIAICLLTPVFP